MFILVDIGNPAVENILWCHLLIPRNKSRGVRVVMLGEPSSVIGSYLFVQYIDI